MPVQRRRRARRGWSAERSASRSSRPRLRGNPIGLGLAPVDLIDGDVTVVEEKPDVAVRGAIELAPRQQPLLDLGAAEARAPAADLEAVRAPLDHDEDVAGGAGQLRRGWGAGLEKAGGGWAGAGGGDHRELRA